MKAEIVWLVDHKEPVLNHALKRNDTHSHYSTEELKEAISYCIKEEYRYNKIKGKTYCKSLGLCSEYVHENEVPLYNDNEEAAIWEFAGYVRNEASRKKNNYR